VENEIAIEGDPILRDILILASPQTD